MICNNPDAPERFRAPGRHRDSRHMIRATVGHWLDVNPTAIAVDRHCPHGPVAADAGWSHVAKTATVTARTTATTAARNITGDGPFPR
jgi:hypothetical protein